MIATLLYNPLQLGSGYIFLVLPPRRAVNLNAGTVMAPWLPDTFDATVESILGRVDLPASRATSLSVRNSGTL